MHEPATGETHRRTFGPSLRALDRPLSNGPARVHYPKRVASPAEASKINSVIRIMTELLGIQFTPGFAIRDDIKTTRHRSLADLVVKPQAVLASPCNHAENERRFSSFPVRRLRRNYGSTFAPK